MGVDQEFKELIEQARDRSIVNLLQSSGVKLKKQGNRYWCSSPFSSDSEWSFVVYPNNTFYDWSNNVGGDIIDLVIQLNKVSFKDAIYSILGKKLPTFIPEPETKKVKKPFKLDRYLLDDKEGIVKQYAKQRRIHNYTAGKWMIDGGDEWIEVPSILFRHYDENHKLIGARFRTVENVRDEISRKTKRMIPKFNSRGELGWHILETDIPNSYKSPVVYIMESETSATSLHQYFLEQQHPAVILCFGGVHNKMKPIPTKYAELDKYLLIDYDGDEDKFNSRIKTIGLENVEPLRLILDKGEDISSLYSRDEMYKVSYLLR